MQRLANEQIPIERRDPALAFALANEALGRFTSLFDVVQATTTPDRLEHTLVIDLADTVQVEVQQTHRLIELYARALGPRLVTALSFTAMRPAVPVRAFPQEIGLVLQNLIVNSFQAEAGTIEVMLTSELDEAVLVVQDNGPAFRPKCWSKSDRATRRSWTVTASGWWR